MSGNDIERSERADVDVYSPGIAARVTLRGALGRFLPGVVLGMGVAVPVLGLPANAGSGLAALGGLGVVAACLTLGYWGGLELLRRRLYPDAAVDGRKSFVGGLVAPLAAVSSLAFSMTLGTLPALALFAAVGVVIAVLMFFAWLTPTPDEMRDAPNGGQGAGHL